MTWFKTNFEDVRIASIDLTPKGADLEPVLDAVIEWSHKWVQMPSDAAI